MKRRIFLAAILIVAGLVTVVGQPLSLDSCRALAIRNNKALQMSSLKQDAAHWQRKSALTNYFPKISAVGSYQRVSKEISLLTDEQKDKFSHVGTNLAGAVGQGLQQGVADFQQRLTALQSSPEVAALLQTPQMQAILANNPTLVQLMSNPSLVQQLTAPLLQQASTAFNGMLTNMASMQLR